MIYQVKCTSCGASLNLSENTKTVSCSYCSTSFINENYTPEIEITFEQNTAAPPSEPVTPEQPKLDFAGCVGIIIGVSIPLVMYYWLGPTYFLPGIVISMTVFYILAKAFNTIQKKKKEE